MTGTPYTGDVGTSIQLTIKNRQTGAVIDLSTLTAATFTFQRVADSSEFTRTASLYTDGTDGVLEYVTVAGDFDVAGKWKVQPSYTLSSGGPWSGDPETFTVKARLSD